MNISRLHQVAIFADDLTIARDFYEATLGAKFIACFEPPGLLFFDIDGTRLLLEKNAPKGLVYFRTPDLNAAVLHLTQCGISLEQPPQAVFKDDEGLFGHPGDIEWMAFFKDPFGNTLALAEHRPG